MEPRATYFEQRKLKRKQEHRGHYHIQQQARIQLKPCLLAGIIIVYERMFCYSHSIDPALPSRRSGFALFCAQATSCDRVGMISEARKSLI